MKFVEIKEINNVNQKRNMDKLTRLLNNEKEILIKPSWRLRENSFNQKECFENVNEEINSYVREYNMNTKAANMGFDNLPFFRVDFSRVAYLMAIAYGAKYVIKNNIISSLPMIEDEDKISTVKKPTNIFEHGLYPLISKRMLMIQERYGNVPFIPSDTQSPIDVATTILRADMCMIAMYTKPNELKRLLEDITNSIEQILKYQKSLVNNFIGYGHDYPITKGVHLSDDAAAFLSPSTYLDFAKPYNDILSNAFDGVTLHCCMKYEHNLDVMSKTEGFIGFDPQFKFNDKNKIINAISNNGFLRVYSVPDNREAFDFYKEIIKIAKDRFGLMIEINGQSEYEALNLAEKVQTYINK